MLPVISVAQPEDVPEELIEPPLTRDVAADKNSQVRPSLPVISIEADSFDFLVDQEKAIFRGDVNASQGNATFRTSQLTVHLDQIRSSTQRKSDSSAKTKSEDSEQFELSAATLFYELEKNLVVGKGNSRLQRGRELILADVIHYDMAKRVAYARPDANGRVFVRFFSNPDKPLFPSSHASANKHPVLAAAE